MPASTRIRTSRRARVSATGRVTLPKPVRDALGIGAGSDVAFEIAESGDVTLRRHPSATPLRGALRAYAPTPAPSVEEVDEGIGRAVAGLDAASRADRG